MLIESSLPERESLDISKNLLKIDVMVSHRKDFPALQQERNGKPPIYLDNACMTLKPSRVIKAIEEYYLYYPACGGRSNHWFAKKVDEEVEKAREKVKSFINAKKPEEIVFTKNTTESINLIAYGIDWDREDVVLTTDKEHNSNLCPWQELKEKRMIRKHIAVPSAPDNTFDYDKFLEILKEEGKRVRLVSLAHVSNLDGTFIKDEVIIEIQKRLKEVNPKSLLLLDSAQAVPHRGVDVQKLGVDLLVFSIHKMCGPTGVGVLYGREDVLKELKPFITGGGTIIDTFPSSPPLYQPPPLKFEAGLQNYAGIIGAGEAVSYLQEIGMERIKNYEIELNSYLTEKILEFDEVEIVGPKEPEHRSGILSFFLRKPCTRLSDDDPDIDEKLSEKWNIMIRKGSFCVNAWYHSQEEKWDSIWPGFRPTMFRVSLYLYNTEEECDCFIKGLKEVLASLRNFPTLPKRELWK